MKSKLSSLVVTLPASADVKATQGGGPPPPRTLQDFHDRVSKRIPEPGWGKTRIAHIPSEVVSDTLQSMAAEVVTKASLLAVIDKADALTRDVRKLPDGALAYARSLEAVDDTRRADFDAAWQRALNVLTVEDLVAVVEQNEALARRIRTVTQDLAKSEAVQAARAEVERWFEGAMDGASRLYRRQHRKVAAIIAAVVVLLANVDSIGLLSRLREDRDLRVAAATAAAEWASAPLATTDAGNIDIAELCERIAEVDTDVPTTSEASPVTETPTTEVPATTGSTDTTDTTDSTQPTEVDSDSVEEARRRFKCASDLFASSELIGPIGPGATWDEIRAANDSTSVVSDVRSFFANSGPWGRVVTWLALLFGASFWYDVLRRLVGLKGKSKEVSGG